MAAINLSTRQDVRNTGRRVLVRETEAFAHQPERWEIESATTNLRAGSTRLGAPALSASSRHIGALIHFLQPA